MKEFGLSQRKKGFYEIEFWIQCILVARSKEEKEETYRQLDMVIDFAYSIDLLTFEEAENFRKRAIKAKEEN